MTRKAAFLLVPVLLLSACSDSNESAGDVSDQTEQPGEVTPGGSSTAATTPLLPIPAIPEQMDVTKEENYKLGALNMYLRMRQATIVLLDEIRKNDYTNPAWTTAVTEKVNALKPISEEFKTLNAPADLADQDAALRANMDTLIEHGDFLLKALEEQDGPAGVEAIQLLQDELNSLTKNGKFEGNNSPMPSTIPPLP